MRYQHKIMNLSKNIISIGLTSMIFGLISCNHKIETNKQPDDTINNKMQKISFDDQLKIFQRLGFKLNEGVDVSDVDRWTGDSPFEKEPFSLMYVTLGQELEREPWTPLTNKCWSFDTEAITADGDYLRIINNLQRITRGELQFENMKDSIDIPNQIAWISFTINGDSYKWNMKVNDDWVDTDLFSKIVDLTNKYQTEGKFTYFNTGGQDALIGYETPESLKEIKDKTGLKIEWLK